ncbi:MAG: hypothetical protein AB7P42_10680 [Gammaproteobacteria bacterium]
MRGPTPGAQRGVALILVMMVMFAASSFVVLRALNVAAARESNQRLVTQQALAEARRALIGYAAGYADGEHAATKGPGFLPCPDLGGGTPGVPASNCLTTAGRETGRLPYHTLGLTELRDGSGAPLWYAVSERFRAPATTQLNPDTPAALSVDARDELVAVIIAPGAALPGQVRDAAGAHVAADWLEGENASVGDARFSAQLSATGNDTVLAITRGELLEAAQKVVLAEVGHALEAYHRDPDGDDVDGADPNCAPAVPACDDAMPWLAPRTTTTWQGVVGLGADALARLPITTLGQAADAAFVAAWSIPTAGVYSPSGAEAPSEACLRDSDCTQDFQVGGGTQPYVFKSPANGSGVASWSVGSCTVDRAADAPHGLTLACTTSFAFNVGARALRRSYRFEFESNLRLFPPTASARRTLRVDAQDSWPGGRPASITITDSEGATTLGTARLRFDTLAAGETMLVRNVPFELEALDADKLVPAAESPGALPPWFVAQGWPQHVFAQYDASLAPAAVAPPCAVGSCFTLRLRRAGEAAFVDQTGVAGVVLTGGPALTATAPPQTRPSAALADYLEGDNATLGTTRFERRPRADDFNDQLRELTP